MKAFPKHHTIVDSSCIAGDHYDKPEVDAWLADWRERILEELGDGDVVTMENCLREILEALSPVQSVEQRFKKLHMEGFEQSKQERG